MTENLLAGDVSAEHPCMFEAEPDVETNGALYVVRCRCHENHWHRLATVDDPHRCPVTGRTAPAMLASPGGPTA